MTTTPLAAWSCCSQPPGAIPDPAQLASADARWLPATAPGTVASALQAARQWDLTRLLDADAHDWWYRTSFEAPPQGPCFLAFDGLATLAEVWLNGVCLLKTDNMFRAYQVEITPHLKAHNDLVLGFRSLTADLGKRRARPRWKTNLVAQQQLRWRRATLLGRIPGWSPPVPAVGPWREVRVESGPVCISDAKLATSLERNDGIVALSVRLHGAVTSAKFRVGDREAPCAREGHGDELRGSLVRIPDAPLWWPHTHGEQPRLGCSLIVQTADGEHTFELGKVAFRRLEADQSDGLSIRINDAPIYCRGACWTVADIVTLTGDRATLEHDLRLARDAGVNLLRVGGTMVYESDAFYDLCDELGILVWQDFMFANMDYPVDDAEFAANIEAEARYQIGRLARHPCVAVYCGGSEIEQQAAMLGMPRELWTNHWFAERLPALCADLHPGTTYVRATPSGGVLPFHTADGITHYYGIGAYLRSMSEVRQADVKFTSECLGFANVPEPETINVVTGGNLAAMHHPQWKQRVPRDTGAGWDFEDVRDHYVGKFFGVNVTEMRCFNVQRYLQLGRVVTGEMMAQVFSEWRSSHSNNQGGLVWFYKDLWPGAGWGIVDSLGRPKAAYYYLRRAWATRQITLTDEGLDGLHVHVINESAQPLCGSVEIVLLKDQHIVSARQSTACDLEPRARRTFSVDAILGAFYDVTYAYRFGPPHHDVVIATLLDAESKPISEAFYFVHRREPAYLQEVEVEVETRTSSDGWVASVSSDRFLQSVSMSAEGHLPDDNYFHLTPGREKVVHFRALAGSAKLHGYLEALNLRAPVRFSGESP